MLVCNVCVRKGDRGLMAVGVQYVCVCVPVIESRESVCSCSECGCVIDN